jgi:hypothetical protein
MPELLPFLLASACLAQDTSREHAEAVASPGHRFEVVMGGVLDGTNTLGPMGYVAPVQAFEPMRSVRLENTGDTDLVNPWVAVNGKRRWRSARDIVREALETYGVPSRMSDRDKARAIYEYQRRHRFHATTGDYAENRDPVKVYNVYGYTLCGDEAPVLADLWRLAGLKTRAGHPAGHVLSEVWYDGAWHLFDTDEHVINLRRDNSTIAGEEDLVRDHDLVKRTHTYSILQRDDRFRDEFSASLFVHEGPRGDDHRSGVGHAMEFTLRPGEAIEWRGSHVGKHHTRGTTLRDGWGPDAWARLRNGLWCYEPPLRRPGARRGLHSSQNLRGSDKASERALSPEKPGEPAWAVWEIRSPYVIVGGALTATAVVDPGDEGALLLSTDGKDWANAAVLGSGPTKASLDPFFPNDGPARYRYFLKVEFRATSSRARTGLDALSIQNDIQMSALSVPSLQVGANAVDYSDETKGPRSARLVLRWVERAGPPLPAAPGAPVSPPNDGQMEGTKVRFQWSAVEAADGGAIVDYHFELSEYADCRWPLSPNFEKLLSFSAGADLKAVSWTLPQEGLLNPGQRYYWRVRAKDSRGAFGPWSRIWSFVAQAPGVPSNLRWGERQGRDFTLLWDPARAGRKAAHYRVYASNEKGFSISDKEYAVWTGNQKSGGLFPGREVVPFPANLLTECAEPRLRLRASHAFYRVVAVDEKGRRSGPSDVLAAPRPFLYADPPARADAGAFFRHEARSIASIGDVRCRTIDGNLYAAAFWDADEVKFTLLQGPSWLKLDPQTGVLSGTAPKDFKAPVEVTIAAEIAGVGSDRRTFTIKP